MDLFLRLVSAADFVRQASFGAAVGTLLAMVLYQVGVVGLAFPGFPAETVLLVGAALGAVGGRLVSGFVDLVRPFGRASIAMARLSNLVLWRRLGLLSLTEYADNRDAVVGWAVRLDQPPPVIARSRDLDAAA